MEPLPAATAVLVRNAPALEVYLVRRSPQSGFMGGNYVFPGGMVDPDDCDTAAWRALLPPDADGPRSCEEALPYAAAAVRETFEEAGVLLGCEAHAGDLREVLGLRAREPLPSGWLLREASTRGWRFRTQALKAWARWITPPGMKRRFEARFFVARAPEDQTCAPDGREIVHGLWATPEEALRRNLAGEIPLAPPNVVTLHQLLPYRDAEAVLAQAETRDWSAPFSPRLVSFEGGAVILEPWDPQIDAPHLSFEAVDLADAVLPVGEPFSRLWLDGRVWRPVRVR